jgi:hypothetical protein
MTVFPLSKWAIKKIDRIRRNFLWHGSDEPRKGSCLVNWKRVQRPKKLGGLVILDLSKFNMALRLRWQWYKWKDPQKLWANMNIRHSATEESLFRAWTAISLGNGKKVSFWHDRWLQGECPKDIAPRLYKLVWRKNISVAEALHDRKWSRGLQQITSTEDINSFVDLWQRLREVTLSAQEGASTWRFSSNGIYSSSLVYNIQFLGSTSDFIWAQLCGQRHKPRRKFSAG